ncbi:hypothetical protein [Candidatus Halobonum tyrrellensis]|uniref:hypothetical protein n=1 Tax=Candidatus Halobonum tyrrellensis TaxID=1431545 RepID=UPI0009B5C11E|nr:hypothetical protein [Candidatus Halobonum tyrrellensis]
MDDSITPSDESGTPSLDEMMQHLEEAKARERSSSSQSRSQWTGLQRKMRKHRNVAILAKNYAERLDELVKYDATTHRSGSSLKSAAAAVDAHGQLPIYYRTGDTVTHVGIITKLLLDPDPDSREAKEFQKYISQEDTYSDYDGNDELDTTTYIVEQGKELDEPFPMTELRKVGNNEPIDPGFWRSPAYVFQRETDF